MRSARDRAPRWATPALGAALVAAGVAAQSPVLSSISPRGGQRGTEVLIRLSGARVGDAQELFWFGPGIRVTGLEKKAGNAAEATLAVAADCRLGSHPFRVRTTRGITNMGLFWVGVLPERGEPKDNDDPALAPAIPIDATINGALNSAGDVDWFAFEVEAGDRLCFDLHGIRLGGSTIDAELSIHDPSGARVAASDDTALGRLDPWCTVTFAATGRHTVRVAESTLRGSGNHHYRLHVGRFPRPVGALPAGGRPGETVELRYLGDGEPWSATVRLPDDGTRVWEHFPQNARGTAPTPIWLSICDLPNVVESREDRPQRVAFRPPAALNGILAVPREVDYYRFEAVKGQQLTIAAVTRALRSAVDPVLGVRQVDGKYRASSDDSGGRPDSRIDFRAPADGAYDLYVHDLQRRGGAAMFYRIEVTPPDRLASTRISFNGRRDAESVAVPAGGRMMTVLAARNAPRGTTPVFTGLPPGVAARAGAFGPGVSTVPVVFEAAANADLGGRLASTGLMRPERSDIHDAPFTHLVPLIRVRNQEYYMGRAMRSLPVAVTAPPAFGVDFAPPETPLVRGSSVRLTVVLQRAEGFEGSVRCRLPWTPPGVTAGEVTIPADKTAGQIALNASASARPGTWGIAGYGYATVRGGILRTATSLIDLRVVERSVVAKLGPVRTEQGTPVDWTIPLERRAARAGPAKARLLNLPRGVTTAAQTVAPDDEQVTFHLEVATDAPAGRHRSCVLRLDVPAADGARVHHFRGGELRIQKPRSMPPKQSTPAGAAAPVAVTPKAKN